MHTLYLAMSIDDKPLQTSLLTVFKKYEQDRDTVLN